jgi:hypothetical protein
MFAWFSPPNMLVSSLLPLEVEIHGHDKSASRYWSDLKALLLLFFPLSSFASTSQ